jgi:hypothetical protein
MQNSRPNRSKLQQNFAQTQAINHSVILSGAKHPATSTDCGGWLGLQMLEIGIQRNYPN